MKKTISIVMVLCLALTLTLGIAAAPAAQDITAQLRPDYTIAIDGAERTFYNVNGSEVYPLLYQGTTYLPVRAIAEIMGKLVNWDEKSKTVTLYGTRTEGATRGTAGDNTVRSVSAALRPDFTIIIDSVTRTFRDEGGNAVYPVLYNGSTYLPVRAIGEIMGKAVAWDSSKKLVTLTGDNTVTDADTFNPTTPTDPENYITLDKAKTAALSHAGLKASEVTFVYAKMDYQFGQWVYEIEFYRNSDLQEYDVIISAATGSVLGYDYDAEHFNPSSKPQGTYIGLDKAKEIALKDAGLTAASVTFAYAKLDYDKDGWTYKVAFYKDAQEYYYVIDAKTGKIVRSDLPSTSPDAYITLDKAKSIALSHAGLKASEVTFVCAKLDHHHGGWKYEIEFYKGNYEYDYDIDAATGAILSYDYEAEHHTPQMDGALIGIDAAKKIALGKVPGATESNIHKIKLDYEDGRVIYEGEIKYKRVEYEFEIDAATGDILDWEIDH